jgi:hypothetical protein
MNEGRGYSQVASTLSAILMKQKSKVQLSEEESLIFNGCYNLVNTNNNQQANPETIYKS